ncbi:FIG00642489: hypothetical protein [Escherichia coli IS1]|nr:FIG00642489: hypothetical protein [Escherichia coli IS1]
MNDIAGNPTSVSRVALVDATPPVVTINPVATDNVINTPEHTQAQIISGTVTGAQAGDIVTVTLNNVDYTTVVDGSGNWSLGVPASVVSGLVDGSYPINVSVTDRAGNTGSQSLTVTVNTAAPLIGINSIAGDDVINASEKGADLQITGTSDQPVNTAITVTLNGQNYTTTTDASGNWSVTVPASAVTALGQANYTVTAAVTSNIGNSNTASHNVLVDSALPGVTINPVATDDIINAAEAGVAQTISGQVTGAEDGDTVTITLGGNTYTATVGSNFTWSVSVPAADIQALGNGDLTVSASVTNQNGNTGSGTRDITIDANLPGLRSIRWRAMMWSISSSTGRRWWSPAAVRGWQKARRLPSRLIMWNTPPRCRPMVAGAWASLRRRLAPGLRGRLILLYPGKVAPETR